MSQLDDIWNDMQILMEEVDTDDRNDFKQAVKALMLEQFAEIADYDEALYKRLKNKVEAL